ncbi:MAG: hypothetical protein LUG64_05235 [Clostridiales bacterium]|nr:hypothetical protein [Clostridiales bacterium]
MKVKGHYSKSADKTQPKTGFFPSLLAEKGGSREIIPAFCEKTPHFLQNCVQKGRTPAAGGKKEGDTLANRWEIRYNRN